MRELELLIKRKDKMIKYSIYTENKNLDKIESILNDNNIIKGYTIIKTIGYWQGLKERALKIEVLLPKYYDYLIKTICKKIKIINRQQAVLYTVEKIKAYFI